MSQLSHYLLLVTVVVRGLGAGMLCDVAFVSLPLRRTIGAPVYVKHARALFTSGGAIYATVALSGAALTLWLSLMAVGLKSGVYRNAVFTSLGVTILAFLGTGIAFPLLKRIIVMADDDERLSKTMDRFARWHSFSAICQLLSFVSLVIAAIAGAPQ